jgi:hypothetical protein
MRWDNLTYSFWVCGLQRSIDLGWLRQQRRPLHSGRTEQHKERRTLTYCRKSRSLSLYFERVTLGA